MIELKGKPVADDIKERAIKRVEELRSQGIIPKIATIRVGDDPGDIAYEHGICSRAEEMGIDIKQKVFAGDISQERLLAKIAAYNEDQDIHGVLIFRPLPKQFDDKTICKALDFRKDVDGITTGSMAGVFTGSGEGFPPCTAEACIRMLDYYGYDLTGKKVTVFGRSLVIGKPVTVMALDRNATVTICHSRTTPEVLREAGKNADVLITAVGRANFLTRDLTGEDQIILDVGINDDGAGGSGQPGAGRCRQRDHRRSHGSRGNGRSAKRFAGKIKGMEKGKVSAGTCLFFALRVKLIYYAVTIKLHGV